MLKATVVEVGASTMPEVPVTNATVVAKVVELFKAPQVLHLLTGRTITVLTAGTDVLEVGQERVFAGRGVLYGQSLVIAEERRAVVVGDSGEMAEHVRNEVESARRRALLERVANASVIVAGTVSASEDLPRDPLTEGEHAPHWAEAQIEVHAVAKGDFRRRVAVYYPRSTDIRWYRSPKLEAGQKGVWLLADELIAGLERTGLTALSPLDFHSSGDFDRIEALARELY